HYPNGHPALERINLKIAAGDRIALVGQNGSGKSTLARLLAGLHRPSHGSLHWKGEPHSAPRPSIGLLFQDPDDQLFCNTLYEDVAFGPLNQGRDRQVVDHQVRRVLHEVGLAELMFKAPHQLSYGQKKRAALATVLAMDPEVLILDEPTANLDPRQEEVFLQLLKDFHGTLICISHDLLFLFELCPRAVVLDRGQIHHDYTLQELVAQRDALREHGLDFSFRFDRRMPPSNLSGNDSALPGTRGSTAPVVAAAPVVATAPLIELRDLTYNYPDGTHALRGVDLAINARDTLAIVGENGAGKTTLLSCLMGILPAHGDYLFAGQAVERKGRKRLWKQIGMVFQDSADQLFCPSCAAEIAFGPRQMGLTTDEIERRVAVALAAVRLTGYEERVPLHLSGGERKRLALASVLSMQPEVLILDEPSAGLDPEGEELLLEIVAALDVTKILVSHDLFFVDRLTTRTIVLHQGRVQRDYATTDFFADQQLNDLNRLDFGYRGRSGMEIQQLQHQHAHAHQHKHLHDHQHRHGDYLHSHPHEHVHEHIHEFVHVHPNEAKPASEHRHAHEHPPVTPSVHEHQHPGHEFEEHEHEHE
ncbi:MAG: ABC transporter ATP-binding protein, partial [Desulfuromonadales bacterium]|nr:ABC transporter ATP-binding protein [Desulfuromonadales bacterium]